MIAESDEDLADAAAAGDVRALERLFRRHVDRAYRLARRYLFIHEDAEEAASEAFIRVFKALSAQQFRGEASFKTWLARIVVNVCLERLRQPRLPALALDDLITEPFTMPSEPDPLWDAIDGLADDQRLAITLRDLEGYSAEETAQIMGKTLEAARSIHYRARRALKNALEQNQNDEIQ
jgi:RNA polymerase sigma-70 factor (ECF subfamily)